jgi:hypothetical protein
VVDDPVVVGDDGDAEEASRAFHAFKRPHVGLEPVSVTPTL